ncbi:hypothetical protein WJX75_006080 [Coccomyxa subellipsoidea]|uniref:Cyclin-like domain-containing protein n=1 Tax=Coccomyxa subellipsoidea TaxID=248742 RepID=A0ABR2YQ47_9CHLO
MRSSFEIHSADLHIGAGKQSVSNPCAFPRSDSESSSLTAHPHPQCAVKKRNFASIEDDGETPTKRAKDADETVCSDGTEASEWLQSVEGALHDAQGASLSCSSNADLSCEEFFEPVYPQTVLNLTELALPRAALTATCDDPDQEALRDVQVLFRELSAVEAQVRPDPLCLENHSAAHNENYIDNLMRAIAISWLVEVACEYGFHQETLHTAASLLDRFLSASKGLSRSNLQLVSVACMLIASKNEEERYPSVQDFTSISDNCFRVEDLLRMEGVVLQTMDFRINAPTGYTFLCLLKQHIGLSPRVAALAVYLLELGLLKDGLLACPGALKAASAVLVASACEGRCLDALSATLQSILGMQYETLPVLALTLGALRFLAGCIRTQSHAKGWQAVQSKG